ncbi:hypothetical protein M9Y10_034271 [Tritrichomonas musculus]|uniref:RRM domain-containing protein n=1 Tax=Tritrichomonas musculus TaxID=1915356 RepID=A0ABR2KEI8_9EUKA
MSATPNIQDIKLRIAEVKKIRKQVIDVSLSSLINLTPISDQIALNRTSAPPNNDASIFISNLNPFVKKEELQSFFSVCGDIVRTTIISDPYTHKSKYAYIEFSEVAAAEDALQLNDRLFKEKNLEVLPKRNTPKNIAFKRKKRSYASYKRKKL